MTSNLHDDDAPDYPTPDQLRPKQREMLEVLSDLKEHTVEDLWETGPFKGFRRNTIREILRLLRKQGYVIASPEKKMAKPYTYRLVSLTPVEPSKRKLGQRQTIAALRVSLCEMLSAYWGRGDGDDPPEFIKRAAKLSGYSLDHDLSLKEKP
jgi:hypothetical protein